MFNIPMNTKGALSADSLMSLNNGGSAAQQNQQPQYNQATARQGQQPQYNQPFAQQNQQQYNQPFAQQNQQPQYNQPFAQQSQQPQYNQQAVQQSQQPQYNQQAVQQSQQPQYNQPIARPAAPKQRPNGNGVHLKKGQKTSLSQMNPNLSEIQVCLGWDVSNQACDLDASAFMLGANDKVIGDDWFVFYGQTISPDGSIVHHGDSSDGAAVGDDEIIDIKLNQIDNRVQKIVFIVTINEALERHLNFSMVSNAYVRVVDKSNGNELVKFKLTDYFVNAISMVVGEVYNKNGQWRFNPVGNGFAEDLEGLCGIYGVNVAD